MWVLQIVLIKYFVLIQTHLLHLIFSYKFTTVSLPRKLEHLFIHSFIQVSTCQIVLYGNWKLIMTVHVNTPFCVIFSIFVLTRDGHNIRIENMYAKKLYMLFCIKNLKYFVKNILKY